MKIALARQAVRKILNGLDCSGKLGNGILSKILADTRIESVSILFADDTQLHRLNLAYRNKNKPTDVLSFPSYDKVHTSFYTESLGDVAISTQTALSQAPEYGNNFEQEILRLLIHGILHLCGYDHEQVSVAERRKMMKLEDQIAGQLISSRKTGSR